MPPSDLLAVAGMLSRKASIPDRALESGHGHVQGIRDTPELRTVEDDGLTVGGALGRRRPASPGRKIAKRAGLAGVAEMLLERPEPHARFSERCGLRVPQPAWSHRDAGPSGSIVQHASHVADVEPGGANGREESAGSGLECR